jgi:hypothetical protein
MKWIFSRSLTHGDQRHPRIIWPAALLLALSLLLAFTSLASPAFAATRTSTASNLVETHIGVQVSVIDGRTSLHLTPFSASGCVGNLPWNNVQTCFGIVGSGRYVDYMWASGYVRNSDVTMALQITGPPGLVGNTPFVYVRTGETLYLQVNLNRNMSTGQYCGQSIVLGPGSGKACESVVA